MPWSCVRFIWTWIWRTWRFATASSACEMCSVPLCDFPKQLRPWFLLEEVEGVEYLHARGKRFEVRVAEYLLLRSFGVNQLICKPSHINHRAKPGVDPATGKEVKASQQSIRVATDWSSLETPIMALQFLQVPAFRSFGLGLWSFQMVAEKAASWRPT